MWGSVTNAHSLREHAFLLGKSVSVTPTERRSLDIYLLQLDLIDRMYRQGMPMLVTDDAGVPNVTVSGFPLALASTCARTTIVPTDIIRMATATAAAALGIDAEVGTLDPGKRADLLVVDGDPTQQPEDLTRTAFVIQEGRLVCAEGRLL
jgi:imidazolonepropionase-like amidohydrolase